MASVKLSHHEKAPSISDGNGRRFAHQRVNAIVMPAANRAHAVIISTSYFNQGIGELLESPRRIDQQTPSKKRNPTLRRDKTIEMKTAPAPTVRSVSRISRDRIKNARRRDRAPGLRRQTAKPCFRVRNNDSVQDRGVDHVFSSNIIKIKLAQMPHGCQCIVALVLQCPLVKVCRCVISRMVIGQTRSECKIEASHPGA